MSDNSIVETRYGKVRGTDLNSVFVWKGIPYAQPPIDNLRFHPPQQPEAWTDIRDATAFGPTAPQQLMQMNVNLFVTEEAGTPEPTSEDCLYLNIWSPQADDRKRPVMVWIHGGAFVVGSGSQPDYDGATFAEQGDLVVVTLNYRLGVLGFLYLEELAGEEYATSGNNGLLDQIAALQWVRENIAAFGGDPDNVTIFGESAGAMSIGTLLAMPASQGLFGRAILESGAGHSIQSKKAATKNASEFLRILKLEIGTIASLAHVPVEDLLAAQNILLSKDALSAIRPVIDGTNLPLTPIEALAQGAARDVTILIGTNHDEIRLFVGDTPGNDTDIGQVQQLLGDKTVEIFTTYATAQPGVEMGDIGLAMFTDYTFRLPAIRLAEKQVQQGASVWVYRFDWAPPGSKLRACHAIEMPFVWNTFKTPFFRALTGSNPPSTLAQQMHASWIAFARTGNPTIPELPAWPAYDINRRSTMLFDEQCSVVDDPQGAERAVWEGLL